MNKCRLCQSERTSLAFDFGNQPIVHRLLESRHENYAKFPFKLCHCIDCGFLQMVEFLKPETLYKNYFTLSSWKAQPHAKIFLENIIKIFDIEKTSKIFEIGCNDGGFLTLLRNNDFKNFLGIEPTEDASNESMRKGLPTIKGFYDRDSIDEIAKVFPAPDLIVSRQVIEHIPDLDGLMESIKGHLRPGGALALELPDSSMNYEEFDYSLWEEHVNYFTIHTIRNLLYRHGFEIIHYESTLFTGKCLFVYAVNSNNALQQARNTDNSMAHRYIKGFSYFKNKTHDYLSEQSRSGKGAIYGSGARSCNFINLLGLEEYFSMFIDDQPEKQNRFVPGCELPVRNFSEINSEAFVALGVNTENEHKVQKRITPRTSFSILPPSSLLPVYWRNIQSN